MAIKRSVCIVALQGLSARIMRLDSDILRLYPDVVHFMLAGALCLIFTVYAGIADRRRLRRKRLDSVGFMPWSSLSLAALVIGLSLLGLAYLKWTGG